MTVDVNETKDGGVLRDRYGRRQMVAVDKHAALIASDIPAPDGAQDLDGRQQVVLLDQNGNSLVAGGLRYSNAPPAVPADVQSVQDPSGEYGAGVVFGNAASHGFGGTGTPLGIHGALGVHQKYGDFVGLSNADILKTTQGIFVNVEYFGRTTDDSAQGGNVGVYMKDTGTPYTQSNPVTAWEAGIQIENGVHAAQVVGNASRLRAFGSAVIDTPYGMKASLWTRQNKGNGYGSAAEWKAFYDELYNPAASSFGLNSSFHGKNIVASEQGFVLARTGHGGEAKLTLHGSGGGSSAMLSLQKPDPAVTSVIADGAFTNLSREMVTATAPTIAWIGRDISNANVPAGTQVLNYFGTGPYTVVMTAAATATVSGQAVTIGEPDLIGVRVISRVSGNAAYEGWGPAPATNPNFRVSRVGGVFSTSGLTMRDPTMATDLAGIDATGYHVYSATLEQSTVGGVGGASAPPATPRKWFKVKDSAGTVLVIPAYLAS